MPVLEFDRVSKHYRTASGAEVAALRHATFAVERGEVIAVVGRSGSGKSTLLHLAAGIDIPTEGRVLFRGQDLARATEAERTRMRRDEVGLVFQFFHLLPHLTVRDNVALPTMIAGVSPRASRDRIDGLLDTVGLLGRAQDTAERLSGGEMQRVAICRALVRQPAIIFADEPTGNLDDESGRVVMDMMFSLVHRESVTMLYVTHSRELAARADRQWTIHSGQVDVA